jgi:hypothetical protein
LGAALAWLIPGFIVISLLWLLLKSTLEVPSSICECLLIIAYGTLYSTVVWSFIVIKERFGGFNGRLSTVEQLRFQDCE